MTLLIIKAYFSSAYTLIIRMLNVNETVKYRVNLKRKNHLNTDIIKLIMHYNNVVVENTLHNYTKHYSD